MLEVSLARLFARSRALGVILACSMSCPPALAEGGPKAKLPTASFPFPARDAKTSAKKEAAAQTPPPPSLAPNDAKPSAQDPATSVSAGSESKGVDPVPEAPAPGAAENDAAPSPAATTSAEREQSVKIEACFEAFEQSQVHLKKDDLLQAAKLAEQCSRDCPEEITTECRTLRFQVDRDMPTALLLARTERGTDAPKVVVHIDGVQRSGVLSEELSLNPGPHSIVFSRHDGWKETVDIVVRRSEKRRQIRVVVPDLREETQPGLVSPKASPRWRKGWAIGAFSLGGAGVATMTLAGIVSLNRKGNLDEDCGGNQCEAPRVDERTEAIRTWLVVGDVGLAVGIVGVAAGTGLLIWEAASKKSASRAQITLEPTWGGAFSQISGSF